MPVQKDEGAKHLSEVQVIEIENMEKEIDSVISERYVPGGSVTVVFEKTPHGKVIQQIERHYKDTGWKVKTTQNADGGLSFRFG
ncbi:MAG: hypothetical protein JSV77_08470 [Dehalococcoidales bacterium]|nr:MAG: hypothetical protein JSV77_08470 [Dehalococcoidales bacterium]